MTLIRFPRYNRCATRLAGAYRIAGYKTNQFPADWYGGSAANSTVRATNYFSWDEATQDESLAAWENYDWLVNPVDTIVVIAGTSSPTLTINRNGIPATYTIGNPFTVYPNDVLRFSIFPPNETGTGTVYLLAGVTAFGAARFYSYTSDGGGAPRPPAP